MPSAHETLIVCFLGDPAGESGERPRVLALTAAGAFEDVALRPAARRLLGLLALPRDAPLSGLTAEAAANRFAGSLAAPPPHRTSGDLEGRLRTGRANFYRICDQLRDGLATQGLEHHFDRGRRGYRGLRDATSDVALLNGAIRDERWDQAGRLLSLLAPRDPRATSLLEGEDDAWSPEARAQIAATIELAIEHAEPFLAAEPEDPLRLRPPSTDEPDPDGEPDASPAPDPDEEVVDGEIVDQEFALAVPVGRRAITRWPRRRRRIRRTLVLGAVVLAVGGMGIAVAGALSSTSGAAPSPLDLPTTAAGPWPEDSSSVLGNSVELANLTREIPFGAPIAVRTGDTLLAGVRVDVARDTPWRRQPFELSTAIQPSNAVSDGWSASFDGPSRPNGNGSGSETIEGLTVGDRIRFVHHSVVLLNEGMHVVRHLPDLRLTDLYERPYLLPHLEPGRLYYVEWRMQVVPARQSAVGQMSPNSTLNCHHQGAKDAINTHAALGEVLDCEITLYNWGSGVLHDVRVHLVWTPPNGDQLDLRTWTTAAEADPRSMPMIPGLLNIEPSWPLTELEFVPRSNRLETAAGTVVARPSGDPTDGGALIAALGPGHAGSRTLAFQIRLVPGEGNHVALRSIAGPRWGPPGESRVP
jgi:hypothetical protein